MDKKIIEKKADGDYYFTPYGEFLSYYHAHQNLFTKLISQKNTNQSSKDSLNAKIKTYMVQNVKKTEHFFDHIKEFANILEMKQDDLSAFMSQNFIDALNKVQGKLKEQEIEKLKNPNKPKTKKKYEKITEEILDLFGDLMPANLRFQTMEMRTVILNISDNSIIEPAQNAPVAESQNTSEKKKSEPVARVYPPDKPILGELIEKFGSLMTGEKLEIVGPNQFVSEQQESSKKTENEPSMNEEEQQEDEEVLENVEELQFEEDTQESSEKYMENFSDEVGFEDEPIVPDPTESYTFKAYMDMLKNIQNFQKTNDVQGYNRWMASESDLIKSALSIKNYQQKEDKGEKIPWDSYFQNISSKTSIQTNHLENLRKKIQIYNSIRLVIDQTILELKKLPADSVDLVKNAWPHVLRAFEYIPDIRKSETMVRALISKIPNPDQKNKIQPILENAISKSKSYLESV